MSAYLVTCLAYPSLPVANTATEVGHNQDRSSSLTRLGQELPEQSSVRVTETPILEERQSLLAVLKSTLEMLFGNINTDDYSVLWKKHNYPRQVSNNTENVENKFNILYGNLNPHFVKPDNQRTCCCPKETFIRKLSYRL